MVSLSQAKHLRYHQVLYHKRWKNADGTAQRWVVSGKPRTWKTRPGEVRVPIKRGMYEYGYLTEGNLRDFTTKEPRRKAPRRTGRGRVWGGRW